jgi:hypothetical protein
MLINDEKNDYNTFKKHMEEEVEESFVNKIEDYIKKTL